MKKIGLFLLFSVLALLVYSQNYLPCGGCGGRGSTACGGCYGSGRTYMGNVCVLCNGSGVSTCAACGGAGGTYTYPTPSRNKSQYGDKECHSCYGSGKCSTCNGKGWIRHSMTNTSGDCPNCSSSKCSSCGGDGKVYGRR